MESAIPPMIKIASNLALIIINWNIIISNLIGDETLYRKKVDF